MAEELRALDAGRSKAPRFAGQRIPFLEELLAEIPRGRRAFLEIKCGAEILPALEQVLADRAARERVVVIGFDADVLARAKERLAGVPMLWLRGTEKEAGTKKPLPHKAEWIRQAKARGFAGLDVHHEGLTEEFARAVKAEGLQLHVWTVNDAAVARRVAGWGAASITTDRPAAIRAALRD
jgi:glycerophosphoryl diester phosphodiesterase